MITAVAALAIGGTVAYFSDTETSTGNVISAGTIDIAVNGENPWTDTKQYSVANMVPGDTDTMTEKVKNVGTNPLVLWKKVTVTAREDNLQSEPECTDQGGTWANPNGPCTYSATNLNDLDSQLVYSQDIGAGININEAWNVRLSELNDLWMPFGRVEPNTELDVDQHFHLDEATTNAYQGDKLTFTVTYYAEQIDAPGPAHTTRGVVLENKNTTTDWAPIVDDGTWGILTFDSSTGAYVVKAWGLNGALTYKLSYWNGTTEAPFGGTASGTNVNMTGTYSGFVSNPNGAKYWLRPTPWSSSSDVNTLYEANLVD